MVVAAEGAGVAVVGEGVGGTSGVDVADDGAGVSDNPILIDILKLMGILMDMSCSKTSSLERVGAADGDTDGFIDGATGAAVRDTPGAAVADQGLAVGGAVTDVGDDVGTIGMSGILIDMLMDRLTE